MPKIAAATVAENRELRRDALLTAAATLMQRGEPFTVAEVAKEVGLSRSAVYEYYASAADLIADVLVDELSDWSRDVADACSASMSPRQRVHAWMHGVLAYVGDGRHALLRAAGTVELPESRRQEVQDLHRSLIAPLIEALAASGDVDASRTGRYVWGLVEVAIVRIESGEVTVEDEEPVLTAFVDAALTSTGAH